MICFWMGKTYTAKTPLGDFKVTTPENSLLSQHAVTNKGILVPYANVQLNLTLIPNWTWSVVTISHFQCMTPSKWLPIARILVHDLITNLRRMLVAKFFNSSHDEDQKVVWLQNLMVYKHSSFFRKDELRQILSPIIIFMNKTLLHTCATCVTFDDP